MNVLYLLTDAADGTLSDIIELQRKEHRVTVSDLRGNNNYEGIVEQIFSSDMVVTC